MQNICMNCTYENQIHPTLIQYDSISFILLQHTATLCILYLHLNYIQWLALSVIPFSNNVYSTCCAYRNNSRQYTWFKQCWRLVTICAIWAVFSALFRSLRTHYSVFRFMITWRQVQYFKPWIFPPGLAIYTTFNTYFYGIMTKAANIFSRHFPPHSS